MKRVTSASLYLLHTALTALTLILLSVGALKLLQWFVDAEDERTDLHIPPPICVEDEELVPHGS